MSETTTTPTFELLAKSAPAPDGFYWAMYLGRINVGTVRGVLEKNLETRGCRWSIQALDEHELLSGECSSRVKALAQMNLELGYLNDPDSIPEEED